MGMITLWEDFIFNKRGPAQTVPQPVRDERAKPAPSGASEFSSGAASAGLPRRMGAAKQAS